MASSLYRLLACRLGNGYDKTKSSSSALGIGDDGTIVGTGVYNGQVHAYAMFPSPKVTRNFP